MSANIEADARAPANIESDARALIEFEKMRFDIAWKHFEFHARQRLTMFHFFILVMPFFFGGYFYVLRGATLTPRAALLLSITGAIVSVVFGLLDWRNRDLYKESQKNLLLLEQNLLYPPGYRPLPFEGRQYRGVFTEAALAESRPSRKNKFVRHKFLMPTVYMLSTLLCFVLSCLVVQRFGWKLFAFWRPYLG